MKISIDESSGFCWGVVGTVDIVEQSLSKLSDKNVYILEQIIHNPKEIERLEKLGLKTITHKELKYVDPKDSVVIIRAHGEPPRTYSTAKALGLEIVDATCPLVKTLQKRIKKSYENGYQIVIFGKQDHAEVIGLMGVCNDDCKVVGKLGEDLDKIDYTRKTMLFSQTTMNRKKLLEMYDAINSEFSKVCPKQEFELLELKDTICKYVSDREGNLKEFANTNEIVLFVAGKKSSNGKSLFQVCYDTNKKTYFIEDSSEIESDWLKGVASIGITGATSTPQWYMEYIKNYLEKEYS